jgi:hypothetical protein
LTEKSSGSVWFGQRRTKQGFALGFSREREGVEECKFEREG